MSQTKLSFGLAAVLAMSGAASAGDIWVGNTSGEVDRHRPMGTQVVFPTLCTQIAAMAVKGQTVYLADAFGNIWAIDSVTQGVNFFPQSFITNSLVVHNGDLLAGGADNKVRRIRTSDGAVTATMSVSGQVHTLAIDGDTLYIGGHDTFLRKGSATLTGAFTVIGACGGQVHSLAINGNELMAGALDGRVYRVNKVTGQYSQFLTLPTGITSPQIAMDGAFLVVGGADGFLRWLNPVSGAVQFSTAICANIGAVVNVPSCRADVDRSGSLNANDFQAYLSVWAAGSPHADMDNTGGLNANDFQHFLNAYAAGCN